MNVDIQAARELLVKLRNAYRMLPKPARAGVSEVLISLAHLKETDNSGWPQNSQDVEAD